jgi:hypothetical protein
MLLEAYGVAGETDRTDVEEEKEGDEPPSSAAVNGHENIGESFQQDSTPR